MRVGIYVRVSTVGQNEAGQRAEIERWLRGNGIKGAKWYVDKESGDTLQRADFERLQRDVFNGDVKTIIVWKLDRLSRSMRDGINVLCDWLDKGLRFVSVTQGFDFRGAIGKMIAALLFGVAEMEQETRRERQAAGISVAKQNGVYNGRKDHPADARTQLAQCDRPLPSTIAASGRSSGDAGPGMAALIALSPYIEPGRARPTPRLTICAKLEKNCSPPEAAVSAPVDHRGLCRLLRGLV